MEWNLHQCEFLIKKFNKKVFSVSTALSVNICLSASVFLISRVNCDLLAFLLLGLSLLLFCFWPQLRNVLLSQSPNTIFILLPILTVISIGVLFVLNGILAFIHLILHFLLVGLCPKLLVRMQQWKSTIHGPWDEVTMRARHLT